MSLAATPVSLERILSSSLRRSLTSAASLVRPGRLGSRSGISAPSSGFAACKRRHQPGADVVAAPAGREPAHPPEVVLALGRVEHDLAQRVVLDDPAARQVLGARLGLAPRRQRFQPPKHGRIAARQLEPLPRVLRRESEARRIGQPLHLLVEPGAAAGLAQLLDHAREHRREVSDVGDRIIDLPLVERAAAPVGEAGALVEAVTEQALDEVRIADLLAMARWPSPRSACRTAGAAPCRSNCG